MLSAVAFLTVLGRSRAPGNRTLDWFPVVGTAIGLALGGLWWVTARAWPAAVAAALVVAADLGVTGLLHVDGLIDAADGLLPAVDRSTRLRIMATPESGAFGTATVAAVLILRWAALAALRPGVLLLAGLWCLSRSFMTLTVRAGRHARPDGGLGSVFGVSRSPWAGGAGVVAAAGLCAAWRVGPGLAAAGAGLVAGGAVLALAYRRIDGYTGDVLGAGAVLAETAGLVVAAARW